MKSPLLTTTRASSTSAPVKKFDAELNRLCYSKLYIFDADGAYVMHKMHLIRTLLQQLDLCLQRIEHGVGAERVEVSARHVERTALDDGGQVTVSV